jgi:7tm Odorant receptor
MVRLFKIFLASAVFAVSTNLAVPYFENRLPYTIWIPFNFNCNEIVFWITSILQVLIPMVGSAIVVNFNMIPVYFMGMAATLLSELSERMKMIAKGGKTDKDKDRELVKCIVIHQRIRAFVQKIENCFSITFLAQGLLSSSFICMTSFLLSMVRIFFNNLI